MEFYKIKFCLWMKKYKMVRLHLKKVNTYNCNLIKYLFPLNQINNMFFVWNSSENESLSSKPQYIQPNWIKIILVTSSYTVNATKIIHRFPSSTLLRSTVFTRPKEIISSIPFIKKKKTSLICIILKYVIILYFLTLCSYEFSSLICHNLSEITLELPLPTFELPLPPLCVPCECSFKKKLVHLRYFIM